MKYKKIEGLDGLRGFAAIVVLLSHAGHYGLNLHPYLDFTGIGKHGVFLFFSLSAFLLSFQMLTAKEKLYTYDYLSHFFHRRIFRILPLYFIVILVYWSVGFTSGNGTPYFPSEKSVLSATLMQRAPGVLWAIPPEFKFYFLLPVIIILMNAIRSRPIFVVIALTTCIFVFRFAVPPTFSSNPIPFFPIFLSGVLAAYLVSDCSVLLNNRIVKALIAIGGIVSLAVFLLMVPDWVSRALSRELNHSVFHYRFLFFSIISCSIILAIATGGWFVRNFFELAFLRYTGRISYSLYLWHMLFISPIAKIKFIESTTIKTILFFIVSFVIAELSFRFVEMPFLKSKSLERIYKKLTRRCTQLDPALRTGSSE